METRGKNRVEITKMGTGDRTMEGLIQMMEGRGREGRRSILAIPVARLGTFGLSVGLRRMEGREGLSGVETDFSSEYFYAENKK